MSADSSASQRSTPKASVAEALVPIAGAVVSGVVGTAVTAAMAKLTAPKTPAG